MKTANPTVIECKDLVKDIKGKRIIDHVTLHLESGKIAGLKGVNGSGKTMLMRLVSGLITPTSGSITINGKRLGKDITFPESIGILIENPAFLDAYSGFDNLKLLASIQNRIGEEEIRAILAKVGLDPQDKKKYRKYSLGMKQRLGIAAAVMENPDIIILDEPTNALDSDGVAMLKEILHEQRERGALLLLSCHDLATLKELSDEMYLMESGALRPYQEEGGA